MAVAEQRFHIRGDSPAVDDLMFWSIAGHEGLSRPSAYELTVLSTEPAIEARDVLGHAFDVVLDFFDADGARHERHCQGHAVRFVRGARSGRFVEYRITLRSWLWLLTRRINSRVLQDKPVLDVLDAVFEDSPIQRFRKTRSDSVLGNHAKRTYCVQHQESDYQFVSRLLEDEGIYYWFDAHDAPGTLHMADASDVAHAKLPADPVLRFIASGAGDARFNEISRWVSARRFDTGTHASRDSDYKAIRKPLHASGGAADTHELADFESFEYPGGYFSPDDREAKARLRGDEQMARRTRHWALTPWADVAAGLSFKAEGDPEGARDGEYIIAACTFFVSHPGYEGMDAGALAAPRPLGAMLRDALADDAVNADTLGVLDELIDTTPSLRSGERGASAFLLTVLPVELPFRPPRLTPRVVMPGPQSATVVGPAGDDAYIDKGRVRVQFHWDRYGESNEKSSCWVRVSQPWAGKNWGGYFMPRIGQEVIVDFLNGDPDRPIIVGRMYNDDQPPPYDSYTQSGFKTRSTPGGDPSTFNELRFEDKMGAEQIHVHAERDLDVLVEKQETRKVGTNSYAKVAGDMQLSVGKKRSADIGGNDILKVVGDRSISVGGSQGATVNGTTKFTSMGDWHSAAPNIEVNGTLSYKLSSIAISSIATAAHSIKAATFTLSAPAITVTATKIEQKASGAQQITGGAALNLGAMAVTVDARATLTLQCGASSITLTPAGIVIKGPKVDINGAGVVSVTGAVVKINA